ncbi:MAG: TetR/AcrR family transcriptional regulator, partial [Myxococcota bacterium]
MAGAAAVPSAADTRERILAAALEAFSQHGFDGATTRDIAGRAGVNLSLLQYHFGAKPKLWRAAVDRAFEEMRGGFDDLLEDTEGAGGRELMRRLIRAYVGFVARKPEFVRLMHEEGKRRGPRMRWLVDRHVKPLFARALPQIEQAQREGLLPSGIHPAHFLYAIIGSVDVIFHQAEECRRVTGIDPTEPAAVEAHIRA